jgi:hypothetical protein
MSPDWQERRSLAGHNGTATRWRHLRRHRGTPAFNGVEADDPNWIGVLALQQVADDGFEVCGGLEVGLPPDTAEITKIIED